VLKHHPDKKSGSTGDSNDDAFFKCIQKAMEVLTNSEKRRQFDSVDPEFESTLDEVPTASTFKNVQNDANAYNKKFFKEFGAVFEREARFSKKQPAPLLGQYEDSKEKVEGFYDFWYNFDSWRSFEYLDKEVNEGSDRYALLFKLQYSCADMLYSRDDKRYTEKKNKSERARRKKEDIARVRGIVDAALQLDPRIKRIKQEEKDAREAKKKARSGTATPSAPSKADQEAAKKKAEEEAKKKDEEDKVSVVLLSMHRTALSSHAVLLALSRPAFPTCSHPAFSRHHPGMSLPIPRSLL
jgi:DnaJ family protein C protein 2